VAIKGKSKSRGSKTVTGGPKPAYVPVKTPLLRRRGPWIFVGTLVGCAVVAGLWYGLVQERNQSRDEALQTSMAATMGDYQGQVEPILTSVGQAAPPSSFSAFPSLGGAIDGLKADDVTQDALDTAGTVAASAAKDAKGAADLFGQITPTKLVADKGFSTDFILYIINSQEGFVRAMRLYRQAALLTTMAVESDPGPARDNLVTRASEVYDLATETLARAYDDYVQAQVRAGTFVATPPGTGSLLTGPTG
jgi:hypothetical protein